MTIAITFNGYCEMLNFCKQIVGVDQEKPEETAKQDTEIISRTDERKEAKEKQKYGNNKPKVDAGKILALHRAGWTGAKIADEMGCSTATVSHYIKESRHAGT